MWWLWSLVVQVLHSPLFPSTPWLYLHRSVLLLPDKNDSDIQFDASTTLASLALPKTTASSPTSDQMVEDHASQRSSDLRSVKVAPIRNEGRGPQCYRSTNVHIGV